MGGFFGCPCCAASPSGTQALIAGKYVSATLNAGANNNLNPAPVGPPIWPGTYGRLDLDTTAGDASLTGLIAGADGQIVLIRNSPGNNNLTLPINNAGSAAANQFTSLADTILGGGAGIVAVYYAGSINKWVLFA